MTSARIHGTALPMTAAALARWSATRAAAHRRLPPLAALATSVLAAASTIVVRSGLGPWSGLAAFVVVATVAVALGWMLGSG